MSSQMLDVKGQAMTKEDGTPFLFSDDPAAVKTQSDVASIDKVDVSKIYPVCSLLFAHR
jgi:hypothetical protein